MYYSYRRRSSGGSVLFGLLIFSAIILIISPRARRKAGGCLSALSSLFMGVGKDLGRKVNQVGINISDKFRIYKLSDLAGGFMKTYTATKESKVSTEEEEDNIYFHDLTSRENQTEENDEHDEDIKKYPHE
ncbi:hypothetical protein [Shimazuella kribbensis]|uniref:hypothetical protein n=1 Tax=Shimazuella kribbensis TaxID=139808 RepID=UPI0004085E10|nr:hypothetical protein [Shimazuella kribbensis]